MLEVCGASEVLKAGEAPELMTGGEINTVVTEVDAQKFL